MAGMIGALIVVGAFVLGTQWARPRPARDQKQFWAGDPVVGNEYEIHAEGLHVFVFDKRTGAAWRYFQNFENGKPTSEGFTQLQFFGGPEQSAAEFPDESPKPKFDPSKPFEVIASPSPLDFVPLQSATASPFDADAYLKNVPKPTSSPSKYDALLKATRMPSPLPAKPWEEYQVKPGGSPPSNRIKPSPQPTR